MGSSRSVVGLLLLLLGMNLLYSLPVLAQGNGTRSYTFLDLPISPRLTALGGKSPTLAGDKDPGLALFNPALASDTLHNHLEVGASLYFADIVFNHLGYFYSLPGVGTLGLGVRQIWYGEFTRTDELGAKLGSFSAYDMGICLLYSRPILPNLSVGATLTPILSHIETYNSLALTLDLGANYTSTDGDFSAGLVARNIGGSLTRYADKTEYAPFELVGGASLQLAHAPLRFLFTLQHLENWNYRFYRGDAYSSAVRVLPPDSPRSNVWQRILYETLAHPIVGIEFTPVRYFYAQVSYNFHRAQEMALEEHAGLEGISWGIGIRIRRFSFNFARSRYHAHGANNHLSIALRLGRGNGSRAHVAPLWDRPSTPVHHNSTAHEAETLRL